MSEKDPTADYRKYPKGPNFGLVVAAFCITLLLVLAASYVFLTDSGKRMFNRNTTPNSMVQPFGPQVSPQGGPTRLA